MADAVPSGAAIHDALLGAAANAGDPELRRLCLGQYWTVVVSGAGAGLASTLRSERHIHGEQPVRDAGSLHLRSVGELASLLRSSSAPEASLGLAAVNALLNPAAAGLRASKAVDVLRERGAGRRVAMIGHFPFAERLAGDCGELWVFERGIGRSEGDRREEEMAELLPQADVVAVTATTLMNGTLAGILAGVRRDAFLMMLGPSTPLVPALFEFGFDVLCGTLVDDPEQVLRAVEQGAVTSQIAGVRRVALWREDRMKRRGAEAQRRKDLK